MSMDTYRKLAMNAVLAGLWAGLAALAASGEFTTGAFWAAGVLAARIAIGFVAAKLGVAVPVDK